MGDPPDVSMRNSFLGLEDDEARQIKALHERGEFFWLDLDLASSDAERLGDVLPIPEYVMNVLRDLEAGAAVRRSYAYEEGVVFPFSCVSDPKAAPLGPGGMRSLEVQVLVTGNCIVSVHRGLCTERPARSDGTATRRIRAGGGRDPRREGPCGRRA
ncbi:MAG: hypothetical protein ACRDMH_18430 [Solirubrobacterales bacterium]